MLFYKKNDLFDCLLNSIYREPIKSGSNVLLIGGCSRSGKTTLAKYLSENFKNDKKTTQIINLDSWLISHHKRKANSNVMQRYEVTAIVKSIRNLLLGQLVFPPVYDVSARVRLEEKGDNPIRNDTDIIIIEGTIALAITELFEFSFAKIYVDINDKERQKRLETFYSKDKHMLLNEAYIELAKRELEEVPFLKNTQKIANFIYQAD